MTTQLKRDTKKSRTFMFAALTLLAIAGTAEAGVQAAGERSPDAYTWSAELVAFDPPTNTATVKSTVVNDATMADLSKFTKGDQVVLTWSGAVSYASGVRSIERGTTTKERFTMPVEFVSAEEDGRYVTFRVSVPAEHAAKIKALEPGQWVTATSPHAPTGSTEVVSSIRSYTDVG
jgi:hypothetical protein